MRASRLLIKGNLIFLVTPKHEQVLLEAWLSLLKDDFDSVRIAAIEAALQIVTKLQKSLMGEVLQSFEKLNKTSWRVKYAVVEIMPQLIKNSSVLNRASLI